MKKFIILTTAMISLFMYSEKSRAEFLLEPFGGISLNQKWDDGTNTGAFSGAVIGARAGFHKMGFSFGFDARQSTVSITPTTGSAYDAEHSQIGLMAAYEFPVMVRVWASSVLTSTLKNSDTDYEFSDASGSTFGIGYTGLPYLSMNVEMATTSYSKGKAKADSTKSSIDLSLSYILLSISLPLVF